MHTTTIATPDGPFTLVASDDALLASAGPNASTTSSP